MGPSVSNDMAKASVPNRFLAACCQRDDVFGVDIQILKCDTVSTFFGPMPHYLLGYLFSEVPLQANPTLCNFLGVHAEPSSSLNGKQPISRCTILLLVATDTYSKPVAATILVQHILGGLLIKAL
jgi:hypothetical protein